MGSLVTSINTFLSSTSGSFQSPDTQGELATIGKEMDAITSATYMMARQRLDRVMKPLVNTMHAQMRRDASHAALWASMRYDEQGAVGGMATGLHKQAATQIRSVRYGLSKFMSPSLQSTAEGVVLASQRAHTVMRGVALLSEHARVRQWRDQGYNMMFRHVELGAGLRGLADNLAAAGRADVALAASQKLSAKTHDLNMRKIAWEKKRAEREIQRAEDSAMGSIFGDFLGGFAKSMSFNS